jgi:hypothetical protein
VFSSSRRNIHSSRHSTRSPLRKRNNSTTQQDKRPSIHDPSAVFAQEEEAAGRRPCWGEVLADSSRPAEEDSRRLVEGIRRRKLAGGIEGRPDSILGSTWRWDSVLE